MRAFERYGSTRERTVLSRLSTSTSTNRRQYGMAYWSSVFLADEVAQASSRNVTLYPCLCFLVAGHDMQGPGHVGIQHDRTQIFECRGLV